MCVSASVGSEASEGGCDDVEDSSAVVSFTSLGISFCIREVCGSLSLSISIPMPLPAHVLILLLVTCDAHAYKETVLNALAAIQNMRASQCFVIAPPLATTALMRAAIDGMSFSAPG